MAKKPQTGTNPKPIIKESGVESGGGKPVRPKK